MKKQKCPLLLFPIAFFLFHGCTSGEVKNKINQAGDVAGQTIGEFAEGINSGVQKAFEVQVELSEALIAAGVKTGKVTLQDSTGVDNVLTVYLIFNRDFEGIITAKVYDRKGAEMGRAKTKVSAKKEEAAFSEFRFDARTNIDVDCKIRLD